MVAVSSPVILSLLRWACKGLEPEQPLCPLAPYKLRQVFKLLCDALEIQYLGLSWYSLRRGGATANFMLHGNLELTLQFGRWSSTRTSKRYVMQAVAEVAKMSLNGHQQALLREAGRNVHKFLREVTLGG